MSDDGPPTERLHLACQAADEETIAHFHAATVAAGGRNNGGPGERSYHPGYYSAYVLDPDGNNWKLSITAPPGAPLRPSS